MMDMDIELSEVEGSGVDWWRCNIMDSICKSSSVKGW